MNVLVKLMDLLTEGIYDKGLFKAVFMAGGPGSGKSFVAKNIFGIPVDGVNISVQGLKTVNSDREFNFLLRKYGFEPQFLDLYPAGSVDDEREHGSFSVDCEGDAGRRGMGRADMIGRRLQGASW